MEGLMPWDCECSSAGNFASLSTGALGFLILWGFLRCCWGWESYIINAEQLLADWLSPHWFFVQLWQEGSWIWGVRLQAVGTGRRSTHPRSALGVRISETNTRLQVSHVLHTLALCLPKHQGTTCTLQVVFSPDHTHARSGGSLCPNSWHSLVRSKMKAFSGHQSCSCYYNLFSPNHLMANGLATTPYQNQHQLGLHQNHQKMTTRPIQILPISVSMQVDAFKCVWSNSVTLVCVWILPKK